jgi:SOS-response transcriptional repressor LexA
MKIGDIMDVANWVRSARNKSKFSQEQLGEMLSVTKANVSAWENGRHEPSLEQLEKISGLTGHHLPFSRDNVEPTSIGGRRIPVLDYVQAGAWTAVREGAQETEPLEYLLTDLSLGPDAFAMRIRGDSMLPQFKEGDVVIIDRDTPHHPGDFVVAVNGRDAVFKQYRDRGINEQGKEIFELLPLNKLYPTIRSDITDMRVVGTMVEHRTYRKR